MRRPINAGTRDMNHRANNFPVRAISAPPRTRRNMVSCIVSVEGLKYFVVGTINNEVGEVPNPYN